MNHKEPEGKQNLIVETLPGCHDVTFNDKTVDEAIELQRVIEEKVMQASMRKYRSRP